MQKPPAINQSVNFNTGTGLGYSAVVLSTDSGVAICAGWVSGNRYTFSLDISNHTLLDFQVSTFDCSHFSPPQ
jgi:hypothetical protein